MSLSQKVKFFKVRGCPLVQRGTLITFVFCSYRYLDFGPALNCRRPYVVAACMIMCMY